MQPRAVFSRRALLGLAALSLAGCSKHNKPVAARSPLVPDAAALRTARDGERALLETYDALIAAARAHELPELRVARAIHAAHLTALHGAPPATASGATAGTTTVAKHAAALPSVLRASARGLRILARGATSGANAALLASIAASHETSAQ